MRQLAVNFLVRWTACSLGLWLAAAILVGHLSYGGRLGTVVAAGFILAVINMVIRPLLILLSLPAVILSLGLFIIVINGFTVWLAAALYPPLAITSFWAAILAGIIIGLVNWIVTAIV